MIHRFPRVNSVSGGADRGGQQERGAGQEQSGHRRGSGVTGCQGLDRHRLYREQGRRHHRQAEAEGIHPQRRATTEHHQQQPDHGHQHAAEKARPWQAP
jgi:hypothetical protein